MAPVFMTNGSFGSRSLTGGSDPFLPSRIKMVPHYSLAKLCTPIDRSGRLNPLGVAMLFSAGIRSATAVEAPATESPMAAVTAIFLA